MQTPTTASIERLLEHRVWLRGVARALARDDASADDLEQEVWLDTLHRPPGDVSSPRGWLARVLRRNAVDAGRSASRRARREEHAAAPGAAPDPARLVAEAETFRRVADLVLALDEPYRGTVLSRWFEGLPPREIAARERIPVETVRTRLKRALAMLRERLDRESDGDRSRWTAALLPFVGATSAGECALRRAAAGPSRGATIRSMARRGPAMRPWWIAACSTGLVAGTAAVAVVAIRGAAGPDTDPSAMTAESASLAEAPDDGAAEPAVRVSRVRAMATSAAAGAERGADAIPSDTWLVVHLLGGDAPPPRGAVLHVEVDDPAGIGPEDAARLRELRRPHAIDPDGGPFLVRGLPESLDGGALRLRATAPGAPPSAPVAITLESGRAQVTRVFLVQPRTAEVHVTDAVTGAPIAGATVVSLSECERRGIEPGTIAAPSGDGWGTSDDAGVARVAGLGRGQHVLVADAPGRLPLRATATLGAPVRLALTPVVDPGTVRVRVGAADGSAAAGIAVETTVGDVRVVRRTGPLGEATFDDLPAGNATFVLPGGFDRLRRDGAPASLVLRGTVGGIDVKAGAETTLRLGWGTGPARIAVRVTDGAGRPVAGERFTCGWVFAERVTGTDGVVAWEGFETGEALYVHGSRASRRLTAAADGTVVDWTSDGVRVSGCARRADGTAILGGIAWVSQDGPRARQSHTTLAADGTFSIDGVAPGRVNVFVTTSDGLVGSATVDVATGADAPATVVDVRRPGAVKALVADTSESRLVLTRGAGAARAMHRIRESDRSSLGSCGLPPGVWTVEGTVGGREVRREVDVREGEETVVDLR